MRVGRFSCLLALSLAATTPAWSGQSVAGGTGASSVDALSAARPPGTQVAPTPSPTSRNARGLDYAFNSPTVQEELASLGLKMSVAAQAGPVGAEVLGWTQRWRTALNARSATMSGNYFQAVQIAGELLLDIFVDEFGESIAPGYTLDILKISAAFATAYIYGYFWGA